jgi:UDP-glucose 4-epimerase
MKIFITGVAGFLGSNLADYYIKKNYKVFGCDNLVGGELSNLNKKIVFYRANCENFASMLKIIKNVDVVCHAAAYAHEGLSVFSPSLITKNIIAGSSSVFSAAIQNRVKRIVFCSSMARYGNIKPPFKESDMPKPVDPYGVAKLAAEEILKILCNIHNVEYNIAVPHNIIGPKQNFKDPFRNVLGIMTNRMLQNKSPIIYGDGTQTRSFSDIDDCISCLDQLIVNKKIKSKVVNIGPDEEINLISINELFRKISNILKFNKEPIYYPDRPAEIKNSHCSADLARKILNYKTKYTLDESIERAVDYIKEKGAKPFAYNYKVEIKNKNTPITWKKKII